jgi:hypothetical protein
MFRPQNKTFRPILHVCDYSDFATPSVPGVAMSAADKTLPLAVMPDISFFSVVRQKLKWSGSNV